MKELAAILWVLCAGVAMAAPVCTVEADTNRIRVEQRIEGTNLVLDVHDQRGIGRMALKLDWTNAIGKITIRLHLKGLEHLEMGWGTEAVVNEWSTEHQQAIQTRRTVDGKEEAITSGSDCWIARKSTVDVIETEVPVAFLKAKGPVLRVQWIDFYR